MAQVFGAYLSNELRLSDRTFYGSGDCFVFNIAPRARVYPWTGENEYFIKCELDQFHLGAGEYVMLSASYKPAYRPAHAGCAWPGTNNWAAYASRCIREWMGRLGREF
jgi:hypothetical protein